MHMKAIGISEPGGPDVLKPISLEQPVPNPGEVLIAVKAAGINRPDVFQRLGFYPPPPGAPAHPGLEVAGTIAALGEGVTGWAVGDAVCALVAGGGYAEYVCAPTQTLLKKPERLSFVQAAALPETVFTVWSNVFDRAGLKQGETLLVHGGTSGIGTTAIQMAHALGHTVFTTAGSDEKCEAAAKLGAHAINYKTQDFVEVIGEQTGNKGVNVILDMVGGDYIGRNIDCLALEGRLVFIAFLQGSRAEIDFMKVMLKRLTITGSTLRARPNADKAAIRDAISETIVPLIEHGKITPVIDRTFALDDAAKAHALMESSSHIGKIVLEI